MWWKSYENETNIFRIYWIQSSSLIVTCELWHCLEQSLGQSHNQDFVWLWHWPKDSRRQCHMPHVTIRGLIVTLAQRLFQAMSHLTCHNIWVGVKKLQKSSSWGGVRPRIYRLSGKVPNPLKYFCFSSKIHFSFFKIAYFCCFWLLAEWQMVLLKVLEKWS